MGTENVPWRVSHVNNDFGLCETYPSVLGVPSAASDEDLKLVAQFRSKGRIPVSLYIHVLEDGSHGTLRH